MLFSACSVPTKLMRVEFGVGNFGWEFQAEGEVVDRP